MTLGRFRESWPTAFQASSTRFMGSVSFAHTPITVMVRLYDAVLQEVMQVNHARPSRHP